MPAMNTLANLFVTIYNTEARRKSECVVLPTSKIGTDVLTTLKKDGYIKDYERTEDNRGGTVSYTHLTLPPSDLV